MSLRHDTSPGRTHDPDSVEVTATGTEPTFELLTGERASEVLELLNDDTARTILDALDEGPKPARELAATCDTSRATVYRRLDRLEDATLVEAQTTLHPEGHHRQEFARRFDRVELVLDCGELVAELERTPAASGQPLGPDPQE